MHELDLHAVDETSVLNCKLKSAETLPLAPHSLPSICVGFSYPSSFIMHLVCMIKELDRHAIDEISHWHFCFVC